MKRRWLRRVALALVCSVAGAAAASAQRPRDNWGAFEREYDGRFTFVRLRWGGGFGGFGGGGSAWNHDFPRAEQNLMTMLREMTLIDVNREGSLILTLDDPQLFHYPIVMMWEPGFWTLADDEAASFREYLLKGGMVIFDDFEGTQWNNLEIQMRRVLPELRWVKLDVTHPIFDSFFRMKTIDFPHPMYGYLPSYYALYEDNDPRKRVMAIANHDNDVAEYWEWTGGGMFPQANMEEAYKLGLNYMIYGFLH